MLVKLKRTGGLNGQEQDTFTPPLHWTPLIHVSMTILYRAHIADIFASDYHCL